tara:strand:+ start:22 stop:459 length:438 start_codon:yes stop_codon:yes gene_type:complete
MLNQGKKVMSKQEIFKLQLDAFMIPHVMWRIEVEHKVIKKDALAILKKHSEWKWDEDVEHDAMAAYLSANSHRYHLLVQEVVDCLLMHVSAKKTEELDNINAMDYSDLMDYVDDKLKHVIKNQAFHPDVYEHNFEYIKVTLKLNQ